MARLLVVSVGVFLAVIMLSSETMSLPAGENLPALTLFEAQNQLIGLSQEQRQCKKIGEHCYVADECCSKRCLFYAAKCVS
uniref:U-Asilidin(1)-Dg12 n=1 Tax=Dolopus genitalis TaxID=2488630 RepID=AS1C_DOLGE|nr:RecName: Full=U-Asilidin(1)-Dg12; Flags: Precursor [Dolopus genitalis]AYV99533.1 venom polypeptide [Dolopus genitalis]